MNKGREKMHYGDRDIVAQGKFYTNHVMAMTAEGLHGKSDIAAELAHRDQRIAKLVAALRESRDALSVAMSEMRDLHPEHPSFVKVEKASAAINALEETE